MAYTCEMKQSSACRRIKKIRMKRKSGRMKGKKCGAPLPQAKPGEHVSAYAELRLLQAKPGGSLMYADVC
jgi:hypothetical protein